MLGISSPTSPSPSPPSNSPDPSPFYRLAYVFALAQVAAALGTIFVYRVDDARDAAFIALLYALTTFYMVHLLIPHTLQRDTDLVSRLNKQFVIVNFLLFCWVLSVCMLPLTVSPHITHTLASCASSHFLTPLCLTLGLDMTLPVALIATLAALSYTIYSTARTHAQSLSLSFPASPFISLPPSSASSSPPSPSPFTSSRPLGSSALAADSADTESSALAPAPPISVLSFLEPHPQHRRAQVPAHTRPRPRVHVPTRAHAQAPLITFDAPPSAPQIARAPEVGTGVGVGAPLITITPDSNSERPLSKVRMGGEGGAGAV
ncbi:hypothetical protein B0H11DRAFT_2050237 [Mycena galericulata]|nr:hypothetical protein B0H11DRAFT_2050237 [Mycena galericulata]